MKVRISLGQFEVQLGAPAENLLLATRLAEEAARKESHLLVLPELWSTGYDLENWERHADQLGKGMFTEMARLAHRLGLWLGGSLLERQGQHAYNTFVLYDPDGTLAGCYRKIHLFQLMEEHRWLAPGRQLELASLSLGGASPPISAGMAICYDLRFPEIFRTYALRGAELMMLPAEWPAVRIEHWRVLLQARAIENQCFLAAVNRVGTSKGELFGGHSMLVDPWGEIIAEATDRPELLTADIDLAEAGRARRKIPVFDDRRPESYRLT
jgi:predicted amidohydrolase